MARTRGSGAPAGGESRAPAFAGSRAIAALAGTHESTLVLAPRRRPGSL